MTSLIKYNHTFKWPQQAMVNLYLQNSNDLTELEIPKNTTLRFVYLTNSTTNQNSQFKFKLNHQSQLFFYALGNHQQETTQQLSLAVIHQQPQSLSEIKIFNLLSDQSQAKIKATVNIPKKATNCQTSLETKALLLNRQTSYQTEPQMEIQPNKVQAAHAASARPIDQQQLYYLQTRGLTKNQSEALLIKSFWQQILQNLPAEQATSNPIINFFN